MNHEFTNFTNLRILNLLIRKIRKFVARLKIKKIILNN